MIMREEISRLQKRLREAGNDDKSEGKGKKKPMSRLSMNLV